ncbi:MAG: hypothetical protein R3A79_30215 [Nannocystaceae bacterium]
MADDAELGRGERALAGPTRGALAGLAAPSPAVALTSPSCERLLAPTSERLARIHRQQIDRAGWPDFAAFDRERYPLALRREAGRHWARRAVAEHGSIHQFSAVTHALCEARVGLELLGPLARLLTDEVRHAELCARMALACDPEGPQASPGAFAWEIPAAPWPDAPRPEARGELLTWAAAAILVACCLGETISRPMYDALLVVCTDPVAAQVLRQIQRDEHLHAAFGWDALATLWPGLDAAGRAALQDRLRRAFGGFEATTACGIPIDAVAGRELVIRRGDAPNLGVLDSDQYAMIFFATVEQELFPALAAIGLDPAAAWAKRPTYRGD